MDELDVEVLANCLQFASAFRERLHQLLPYRLVNRRWAQAVATTFQRLIEFPSVNATSYSIDFLDPSELAWSPSRKRDFRAVVVCRSDFSEHFFSSLSAVRVPSCTDEELDWLHQHCPKLLRLDLRCINRQQPSLSALSTVGLRWPCLLAISTGYDTKLEETEVLALLSNLGALKHLRLPQATGCSDAILRSLVERRVQLTVLEIPGFSLQKQRTLVEFIESQPLLEKVDAHGVRKLGNKTLICMGQHLPNLQFLDISWCFWCKARGVTALVEGCRKLTALRFLGIECMRDETLLTLGRCCTNLVVLGLLQGSLTSEGLQGLEQFTLLKCFEITLYQSSLVNLQPAAQMWQAISTLSLESISVTGTDVTDSLLLGLANHCGKGLEVIRFRKVGGFSEEGAIQFIACCTKLRQLSWVEGHSLGDKFLAALSELQLELQHLDLSEQTSISAEGLARLLRSSVVRSLTIFGCAHTNADDSVLVSIAESRCSMKLTRVNVGKTFVSDGGVIRLVSQCPLLSSLDVSGRRELPPSLRQHRAAMRTGSVLTPALNRQSGVSDRFVDYLGSRSSGFESGYVNVLGCEKISRPALTRLLEAVPDLFFNSDMRDLKVTRVPELRTLPQCAMEVFPPDLSNSDTEDESEAAEAAECNSGIDFEASGSNSH